MIPRRIGLIAAAGLVAGGLGVEAGRRLAAPEPAPLACRPSAPALAARAADAGHIVLMIGNSQLHDHDWRFPGAFVVNCARQGLPARSARPLIARLPALRADTIVVAFGAVEIQRAGRAGRAPDRAGFAGTMRALVGDLRARWPGAAIVLSAIPPVRPAMFPPGTEPDPGALLAINSDLARIAGAVPGTRFSDPAGPLPADAEGLAAAMTYDGLHLTQAAYALWQTHLQGDIAALRNAP